MQPPEGGGGGGDGRGCVLLLVEVVELDVSAGLVGDTLRGDVMENKMISRSCDYVISTQKIPIHVIRRIQCVSSTVKAQKLKLLLS